MMTASTVDLAGRGSAYAPSTISTTGATQDHELSAGRSTVGAEDKDQRENRSGPIPSPRTLGKLSSSLG